MGRPCPATRRDSHTTTGQPRSSGSARRSAATGKCVATRQANRFARDPTCELATGLLRSDPDRLARRALPRAPPTGDGDAQVEPAEQRGSAPPAIPSRNCRREIETYRSERSEERSATAPGTAQHQQGAPRASGGTRQAKPDMGRCEGSARSGGTAADVQEDEREAPHAQDQLRSSESGAQVRRTHPEQSLEIDPRSRGAGGIEGIGGIDPDRQGAPGDLEAKAIREGGRTGRGRCRHLRQAAAGNPSFQGSVEIRKPGRKASLGRASDGEGGPADGPGEKSDQLIETRCRGRQHRAIFAFPSPQSRGYPRPPRREPGSPGGVRYFLGAITPQATMSRFSLVDLPR